MNDDQWDLLVGDASDHLCNISSCSVRTCVTSPPYFGLRDYGALGQIGLESSPNEYVRDRCTKAHEYIFLLAKSERYWFDGDAVAERSVDPKSHRGLGPRNADKFASSDPDGFARTRKGFTKLEGKTYPTRNRRSVWTVAPKPYHGAHFAVYPPELIRPCILAGSALGDTVLDPFAGSGTTLAVAIEEGRRAIGCELNPKYAEMARRRICTTTPRIAVT